MWEKVKLGAVFSVIRNGASIKQTEGATGIPITRIETISSGILDQTKLGYADINNNKFESYYLSDGDILMSHINSLKHLGKTALVNELGQSVIHGMNLLLLRTNERCFSKYVKYFFETKIFYGQILSIANQSVNQSSFTVNKLKDLEIPLPPLSIQEKIADILDKADKLRRKDKELQSKYDELAQAIFIDMFGDPVINEKGWKMKKLEEICSKITDGTHHSPANTLSGRKYITAKHIKNGKLDFFKNETYVSEEDHINIYSRCNPEYGDVLYIKDGATTGMAAVNNLQEEFSMLSSLALFKLKKELINNNYLVYYLNSSIVKDNLIREYMAGAAIKRFTLQKIKKFNIVLPPIHLQEEFAKKIEIINQLKKQTNTEKSEELFQSLLQKAFKGELVS